MLFALLNALDFLTTYIAGTEANPFVLVFLARFGWRGYALAKLGLAMYFVVSVAVMRWARFFLLKIYRRTMLWLYVVVVLWNTAYLILLWR